MTDDKFQNKYRMQSARAAWHRYDGGVYFVTICTKNRKHYFGEIVVCRDAARHVSTQMQLSEIGRIATENIQNVTLHYPYAEIPLFVVMPNHIHAIVVIDGNKIPYNRGSVETTRATDSVSVETWRAASLQTERRAASPQTERRAAFPQTERHAASPQMTDIANMQGWLSVVIGGLKSAVTRCAHENQIEFAWQTRFHDRVVRNQDELNRIAEYIENNVAQWHYDDLNNKCIK